MKFNPTRNQENKYDRCHINSLVLTPMGKALTTGKGNENSCFIEVRLIRDGRVKSYHQQAVIQAKGQLWLPEFERCFKLQR